LKYPEINKSTDPAVITIGTYDGVHIGHRKIIKRLVETAEEKNLTSKLLTFFPHPRMVLQQDVDIKLINTITERKKILSKTGIEELVIYPFTKEFSRLKAEEYVEEILVKKLNAKHVIIGYDHRFGRNRRADINDLREFGEKFDFNVEEITKEEMNEVAVSSTKIREAVQEGNLEQAHHYLGDPFILTGTVERGKGMGKKFGYPTANLKIEEDYKLIPKNGVYVAHSTIDGKDHFGLMSIGTNPTVGGKKQSIETYFFDLDKDLYDRELCIEVLKRIRGEKHFADTQKLEESMKKDEKFARGYIQDKF
jgi:riboflavin kinase/FMN adenylyltransferase